MNSNIMPILSDIGVLRSALGALGATGDDLGHLHCPFHQPDEHGSLSVFIDHQSGRARFKCHSCGRDGTIIDAVMARDGCDAATAMRNMALLSNANAPVSPLQPKQRRVYASTTELFRAVDAIAKRKGGKVAATYRYTDPLTGVHDQLVFRIQIPGNKEILPACPVAGGYVFGAPPVPRPIYNRTGIQLAATVIVCEGEKCADAFPRIGISTPATTSPGGAKAAAKADWSPLAGKSVIIWPDNDEPGRQYAQDVIAQLNQLTPPPQIRMVDVASLNLPEGGDIVDYVENLLRNGADQAGVITAVQKILDSAQPVTGSAPVVPAPALAPPTMLPPVASTVAAASTSPMSVAVPPLITPPLVTMVPTVPATLAIASAVPPMPGSGVAGLQQVLNDAIAGRRYPIDMPWPMISVATRALLPGTVTVVCGSPGSTKSFALLQLLVFILVAGVRAAALMMEDGVAYHLRRALAQLAGESELTDDNWCRAHPAEVQKYQQQFQQQLSLLDCVLHAPPANQPATAALLVDWIARQAHAGARVIAIDPVTAMAKTRYGWLDDEAFLWGSKRVVEQFGASLVLVTHPAKLPPGARIKNVTIDVIAGGACYVRFSQTLLFLHAHQSKLVTVLPNNTNSTTGTEINRTMTILKARNGRVGEGQRFGFEFCTRSLKLLERGQIVAQ